MEIKHLYDRENGELYIECGYFEGERLLRSDFTLPESAGALGSELFTEDREVEVLYDGNPPVNVYIVSNGTDILTSPLNITIRHVKDAQHASASRAHLGAMASQLERMVDPPKNDRKRVIEPSRPVTPWLTDIPLDRLK